MLNVFPRLTLAAALVFAATAPVSAQCSVYRLNVPDFDQRRDPAPGIPGLPGNGNCYCVPTSVMNWIAYISNHGYPAVLAGPRNWQSNAHYNDVTTFLAFMGLPALMNTGDGVDPNGCGTNGTGFTNGAQGWLDSFYPGEFVVFAIGPNGTDVVTPQELYAMEAFGGLVAMCYSRWTPAAANPTLGLPARYIRQPVGHCITLTRVTDACGANPRLWYRDPAGFDGPDTDQSQFVTQISDMDPVPYFYAGNATNAPIFRTMWRFADITSNISMLDSAWVITPIHGISASAQLGEVSIVGMWDFDDLTILPPTTHQLPGASSVLALAMAPRPGAHAAVIVRSGARRLVMLENSGGPSNPPDMRILADMVSDGPICFDRTGRLHVYDNMAIRRLDTTTTPATVMGTTSLPRIPIALTTNDAAGEVVLLFASIPGGAAAGVATLDEEYGGGYMDEDFPPWCVVDPDSTIAVGPGGTFFVATPSTNTIYRLVPASAGGFTGGPITHSSIVQPRNLHCTHDGQLVFTSGPTTAPQHVVVLLQDTAGGPWLPDTSARLAGQQTGTHFAMTVSRQYEDDMIDIDTLENIPDTRDEEPGIPDCIADFNADGEVNVPDIFAYLSAWFAQDALADVNLDDAITVPDIFTFLSAWFAGCD